MIEKLHEKEITELKQKELIEIFLSKQKDPFQLKYHELRTTFSILMESITETFKKRNTKDILPVMGMFSVLDILGSAFSLKGNDLSETVPIKRCLTFFTDSKLISRKEIEALYALRNSLVHNSSLISIPLYGSQNHYFFRYDNNIDKLISHPENEWDGKYETLDTGSEKYTTKINTKLFLELINSCVKKIKTLSSEGGISMNYNKGKREFFYRYFRTFKVRFTEKEEYKIKQKALSSSIKGKIDDILEKSSDIKNFTFIALGKKDSYINTHKNSFTIFEHVDSSIIYEIKRILVSEYNNTPEHIRASSSFYKRDIFLSSNYKIELLIN